MPYKKPNIKQQLSALLERRRKPRKHSYSKKAATIKIAIWLIAAAAAWMSAQNRVIVVEQHSDQGHILNGHVAMNDKKGQIEHA